ncbi:hypothetical protein KBC99_00920 [Candidatus Saccharibacteria bacterium]|nr:hypothetical protein [Candidatus Saccharibacteria bacterium]
MNKTVQSESRLIEWQLLAGGSALGLVSAFLQVIERMRFADAPAEKLFCDINAVINCNTVFQAWQSSVFGFSNAIMILAIFAIIFGLSLAGLTGSKLKRGLRLAGQAVMLFFLGFGSWYMWQSTYVINALCIFCIFNYAAVIITNLAWLRINARDLPIPDEYRLRIVQLTNKKFDIIFWILWAAFVKIMILMHFLNR